MKMRKRFSELSQVLLLSLITGVMFAGNVFAAVSANDISSSSAATQEVSAAVVVTQASVAVPTMNEWGMIFFILVAGIGSVYYMRKSGRI